MGGTMRNPEKVSDTMLLNFMFNARVECRIADQNKPVYWAQIGLDTVYGKTPREALRGLYILRRGERA